MELERIFPMLALILVWFLLSGIVSARSKKKSGAAGGPAKGSAPKETSGTKEKTPPPAGVSAMPEPDRDRVLQPSVSVTGHDDSIYRGSLNAETGEGYDPCHEEQMSPLTHAEREPEPLPGESENSFRLTWSGNEVVRGFVMSEILTRKRGRTSL